MWLICDGAMADAEVWLNGEKLTAHKDGYTPFAARLTGRLKAGDNLLAIKIDGSENPEIPPFGGRIDYLTYAGIYRDVWLKVVPPVSIGRVKIETPDVLAAKKVGGRAPRSRQSAAPDAGGHADGGAAAIPPARRSPRPRHRRPPRSS